MWRAVRSVVLVTLVLAPLAAAPAAGQHSTAEPMSGAVTMIDGLGMIDPHQPPRFKVGSWVDYRSEGANIEGEPENYDLKILVAGEELFWGEECFWLETSTEPDQQAAHTVATLISYSIYDTTLGSAPNTHFQRKTIMEFDQLGNPIQTVLKRQTKAIKDRTKSRGGLTVITDTLGTESITTPAGTFKCLKVREEQGVRQTQELGDSTITVTNREVRITYHTPQVPITGIARTEIENSTERKAWAVGRSEDTASVLTKRTNAVNVVTGFGSGRTASVIPEGYRKSIKRSGVATRR